MPVMVNLQKLPHSIQLKMLQAGSTNITAAASSRLLVNKKALAEKFNYFFCQRFCFLKNLLCYYNAFSLLLS